MAANAGGMVAKIRTQLKVVTIGAAVVLAVGLGYGWLKMSTDSYDQRYTDCMRTSQARLYPEGHYFPDNAYNEAMRHCEHDAGVPTPQTTPLTPKDFG